MSSGSRIVFSVPKPPTRQQTSRSPEATLSWIEARIRELILASEQQGDERLSLERTTYLVIYTAIVDYCTAKGGEQPPHGANLYRQLGRILREHCNSIRTKLLQEDHGVSNKDAVVLTAYLKQWKRFFALAKTNARLLQFLERHWIRREMSETRSGVKTILDLHESVWREEVVLAGTGSDQKSEDVDSDECILDFAKRLSAIRSQYPENEGDGEEAEMFDAIRTHLNEIGVDLDGQRLG